LFVLQVLGEQRGKALTVSEISTELASRYMPGGRAQRNVNIYQTLRRLRKREAVEVIRIQNPNPLRSGQSDAYFLTKVGKALLRYMSCIEQKETAATGAGADGKHDSR